jgi:polysaccharide biosynthesis transport protein
MNNLPPISPQDPGFQLPAPMETNATPVPKFRPKKFLLFLRRFWWVPVITTILALSAAVADFMSTPPEFVSSASMVENAKIQMNDVPSFLEDQDTYFGTLTTVLQSDLLRQMALSRMAVADTNSISRDKNGNPLGVEVSVYQPSKSLVFIVQATSANPAFTPLYVNALVNSYLDYKRSARKGISDDTLASVSDQISQLEQGMKSDQATLTEYEQSNNLVVLRQENEVGGNYLAKLKTDLADYQLQDKLLDAVELEKSTFPIPGVTNMANPLFAQMQGGDSSSPITQSADAYQQLQALKFQREELSKHLRPDHPKIIDLDEQITNAENRFEIYRTQNQQDLAIAHQALKIRMDSVQQFINKWEITVNNDSARLAQADNLQAKISRDQAMYDRLSSILDNVDLTRNIDQDPLAILQLASGSSRSYGKLKSNLSTAGFGGLAIGLGIILLITIRDDRFASVVEVEERIGDSVVGQVPDMGQLGNGAPLALLGNHDNRHLYFESYRNLRSALLYLAVDGVRPKLLLITSAVPNEGKSTIASNLACVMALGGARVLLIDGDLRKGHLHDLLGLKSKPGLAELMLQPENIDKFIQTSTVPNLWFIAGGDGRQNPGDLFLSAAFDGVLAKLREQFDYVIIDSSPIFAADDSTTLAPKMDGTLLVVRSRFSRSNIVKEALELLYQRQAVVLGLILNRTDASDRSYHYYKYSEYHSSAETT